MYSFSSTIRSVFLFHIKSKLGIVISRMPSSQVNHGPKFLIAHGPQEHQRKEHGKWCIEGFSARLGSGSYYLVHWPDSVTYPHLTERKQKSSPSMCPGRRQIGPEPEMLQFNNPCTQSP